MNNELVIRRAAPADLSAVEALLAAHALPVAGVREAFDDFFVAAGGSTAAGTIVGAAGIEYRDGYGLLRSVVVSEEARGLMVGVRVIERVIAEARQRGVQSLYLLTTTASEYFPRFGFQRIDRNTAPASILGTDEFTSTCPASAIAMALHLTT